MSGRAFLQIPGPTNIPERVLRAMDRAIIDHRSAEFAELTQSVRVGLRAVFQTKDGMPLLYPASGTGATEAALVNVLAPGDRVLAFNHGFFGNGMGNVARKFGFEVDEVPLRWGRDIPPDVVEAKLRADTGLNPYKAVLVVHNETSTGVTADIGAIRAAMDAAGHDALLIVDTVSSLACIDFRFDDWRVDIALCGSQKGLMLPPGLGLLCVGPKALERAARGGSPRHFWDWAPILRENHFGLFPYTPATLMLFGLREALTMLVEEEGLDAVFARHQHLADGVRAAVRAWGLDFVCENPAAYSNSITAVRMPDGFESNALTTYAHDRLGLSLGGGLGELRGKVIRIGHLGSLNELEVLATIGGVELSFASLGVPVETGSGLLACQRQFVEASIGAQRTPELAATAA
jgi:alanine-glyoxylate transaminase/serine-glyoxylate transaminase/serine-pyruvate transaminase